MKKIKVSQISFALLASSSLAISPILAADYTVNSATTITNGAAANILDGDDTLTITGTGSIATTTNNAGVDFAGGNITINNYGTISTTANTARAVQGVGLGSNSFNNFGSIITFGGNAEAVFVTLTNFTNSGLVKTTGNDSKAVFMENGDLVNNGTISTTGSNAHAVNFPFGAFGGKIVNNGKISTSGSDSYGVNLGGSGVGFGNELINSGIVGASGNSSEAIIADDGNKIENSGAISSADDQGIVLNDGNIVTNTGSITSAETAIFGQNNNKITNKGTIKNTSGWGIEMVGINNEIINSGNIEGGGVQIVQASKINNSGTITTSDSSSNVISISGRGNEVTNSGIIKSTGNSSFGIQVSNDIENTVTNSGEIYALGANADAFNVDVNAVGTVFNNSGKIISVETNAIIFEAGDGILNLFAPSFIGGKIDMGTGGNAVNITTGRSHSVLWEFPNVTPSIDNSSGVNGVWNGTKFATIDPTALSASVDVSADMVAGASEIVRNNSEGGEFWLKGFGSYAEYGANGIYNDFNGLNAGIIGGASAQINKDFYAGAMLGYAISNLTVNSRWQTSQTVNSKGVIGGFYAKSDIDNFYADFAIFGGLMNNDSSRLVNDNLALMGVDYANANYNSWFISPELRIGVEMASDGEWTITPSVMARYSYQAIDGYTETGSNANATFAARAVQMIEGNVELAASKPLENGTLTLAGGLDYRQNISAGTINSTLIGQNLSVPVNNSATIITYASANASFDMGSNMLFELNGRVGLGTNGYKAISGTVGVSGKF